MFNPIRSRLLTGEGLRVFVALQRGNSLNGEQDTSGASVRLSSFGEQDAPASGIVSDRGLTNVSGYAVVLEPVQIRPAQAQRFRPAHPFEHKQMPKRGKAIVA